MTLGKEVKGKARLSNKHHTGAEATGGGGRGSIAKDDQSEKNQTQAAARAGFWPGLADPCVNGDSFQGCLTSRHLFVLTIYNQRAMETTAKVREISFPCPQQLLAVSSCGSKQQPCPCGGFSDALYRGLRGWGVLPHCVKVISP